jgi:hypothetical protein
MSSTNNYGDDGGAPNAPIYIPEEVIKKMKVKELKTELSRRKVPFRSKMKKNELLATLKASLHLTVVISIETVIEDEEKPLPWNDEHPAKILLLTEIAAGRIPLSTEEMGPAEVYALYADTLEFQAKGMEYGEAFARHLRTTREQVARDKCRAKQDKSELEKALKYHPAPRLNHKGRPQWNGSVAQVLLEFDM